MARIRTIKPEFCTSAQVAECSKNARLLFVLMWMHCDDNGVHPASAKQLRMECFPGDDDMTAPAVQGLVDELLAQGLLVEYENKGHHYWHVTGWKHQRIDKPQPGKYPLPNDRDSAPVPSSFSERSGNVPRTLPPEGKGKEGKGEEGIGEERRGADRSLRSLSNAGASDRGGSAASQVAEVFEHWRDVLRHPQAKLDPKRDACIRRALHLGYSVDQLKLAVDGCARTPHNMGQNDQHQVYDDLGLILRDADHIDRFIRNASRQLAPDPADADPVVQFVRQGTTQTVIEGEVITHARR